MSGEWSVGVKGCGEIGDLVGCIRCECWKLISVEGGVRSDMLEGGGIEE